MIIAASVVALVAIGVSAFVLTRDDALPAEGDLIAFSCKEPKNTWYAICICEKRRNGAPAHTVI